MMTWEALTAITSAVTTVVLIGTVIMAVRQVQLLRRSTQLDGLIRILAEMEHPTLLASYRFVQDELPQKMQDPAFRQRIIVRYSRHDNGWKPLRVHGCERGLRTGRIVGKENCCAAYVRIA